MCDLTSNYLHIDLPCLKPWNKSLSKWEVTRYCVPTNAINLQVECEQTLLELTSWKEMYDLTSIYLPGPNLSNAFFTLIQNSIREYNRYKQVNYFYLLDCVSQHHRSRAYERKSVIWRQFTYRDLLLWQSK